MEPGKISIPFGKHVALVFMLLSLLAVGAWFFRAQEQTMREAVKTDLSAIVRLKVDQIAAWRRERLEDGTFGRAFVSKGRFADALERIPVHVVVTRAALLGAAIYGLRRGEAD